MKNPVQPKESHPEPKKINVWLVRSPEVSKQKFNDVYNLLGSIKEASQLAFQFRTKETELWDLDEEEEGATDLIYKPWEAFFQQAEDFRASFEGEKKEEDRIKTEDYVVILSDHGNKDLWFSGADYGGKNNIFVHCEEWDFFAKGSDVRYPIAYHVVITLLHHKWGKSKEEIIEKVHGLRPGDAHLGCINDFCEDKGEVHLKIRTGDICEQCIEEFLQAGVNKLIILQVLEIIGNISRFMRFSAKWKLDVEIPVLTIEGQKREIFFRNYGNLKLPSTASIQGRILYELVYLKQMAGEQLGSGDFATKEFISEYKAHYLNTKGINALDEGFEQIKEKMDKSIDNICNPDAISRLMSKMNEAFVLALGEDVAKNYQFNRIEKANAKDYEKRNYYRIGNKESKELKSFIKIES